MSYVRNIQLPSTLASGSFQLSIQDAAGVTLPPQSLSYSRPSYPSGMSLRVTYQAATKRLYINQAGDNIQIRILRQDGAVFVMANPDNPNLSSGVFYGAGPLSGQGIYTRQWDFRQKADGSGGIPQLPIQITGKLDNGVTFDFFWTPTEVTNLVLFEPSSTTPVDPSVKAYNKVLFWDNSIGFHPAVPGIGWPYNWGMAATEASKDYRHRLIDKLRLSNPALQAYALGGENNANGINGLTSGVTVASVPDWEANYDTRSLDSYADAYNVGADLLIFAIGENVDDDGVTGRGFKQKVLDLFARFKAVNPTIQIVIRTPVWNKPTVTGNLIQIAQEQGIPFWTGSALIGDPANFGFDKPAGQTTEPTDGVKAHPNNTGMAKIAEGVYAAIPVKNSTIPPSAGNATRISGGFYESPSLADMFSRAPFVPDQNQLSDWPNATAKILENDQIVLGIHKSIGGSITIIKDKRDGINLVNTYAIGQPSNPDAWDTGRSGDYSIYGTPIGSGDSYYEAGQNTNQTGDDTGYNGVPGGSRYLDRSTITFYQRKNVEGLGLVDYVRTTPKQWSIQNIDTQYVRHAWYYLLGSSYCWTYLIECNRTDSQRTFEGREQEGPFIYTIGNNYQYLVELGTDGTTTQIQKSDFPGGQNDTGIYYTTGNYIGSYNPTSGRGLTLFAPHCSRVRGKQFIGQAGDEYSNSSGYIDIADFKDADSIGKWMVQGFTHVGSNAEFKTWRAAQMIPTLPLKWNFSGGDFQGWASLSGKFQKIGGVSTLFMGEPRKQDGSRGETVFVSPSGSWQVDSLQTLYLNAAIKGLSRLYISWLKPGQTEIQAAQAGQYKEFDVSATDSFQTYTFSMAGSPWNGIISRFQFGIPGANRSGLNGSEYLKPGWINTVNQAPQF
ncbi:hypothetical protein CLV58_109168 [Spirosoma oryzae]|uniref:Lysophospholipase L1-like esterase n=1 Tax=Spirosoma oryzae TaxID=1469603 RepID=A0A2T0SYC7_9BACT|nr:SGNH/GDSL hydrolase family protein [Spirosoma oryzae]PRY38441.1 hypothetical protein CLV58_109168 [Spirosoma oryzae]